MEIIASIFIITLGGYLLYLMFAEKPPIEAIQSPPSRLLPRSKWKVLLFILGIIMAVGLVCIIMAISILGEFFLVMIKILSLGLLGFIS